MNRPDSPIVIVVSRLIIPFIQLFALYIIAHGHYSPGGGFQGGAVLAASILLLRLSVGDNADQLQFRTSAALPLGVAGVLIFVVTGAIALFSGHHFLDYSALPLGPMSVAQLRSFGIFFVEVGIGLAVMSVLVMIFDSLVNGGGQ